MKEIEVMDTTLRDGEQTSGMSFSELDSDQTVSSIKANEKILNVI